jgi:acyl dehydratase
VLDRQTDELFATLTTTCFRRKEGGCGNAGRQPAPPRHMPAREPDATILAPTSIDLARTYSRTGDANPIHTDLAVANAAGFLRPILHGLCGFGIAGRVACDALKMLER